MILANLTAEGVLMGSGVNDPRTYMRFRIKIAISFGEVIEFHGGGVFVFAAARRKTSSVVGSRLTLIARGSDAHAQPAILMSAASDL